MLLLLLVILLLLLHQRGMSGCVGKYRGQHHSRWRVARDLQLVRTRIRETGSILIPCSLGLPCWMLDIRAGSSHWRGSSSFRRVLPHGRLRLPISNIQQGRPKTQVGERAGYEKITAPERPSHAWFGNSFVYNLLQVLLSMSLSDIHPREVAS